MSSVVDERVVSMQFDNKQFEANAQQSLSTLEKIKSSLNISKSAEGLTGLDRLVSSSAFQGLASSVDTIADRFTFMGTVAATVMDNVANKIVSTGERIVKEFTLDPINDGFKEYELKMGSVQTIMASSHADLKTVNNVLQELNAYSDQTIYSFSDMTASIGKFTNAGVDLDTAVEAIKGISNEAALSGANANEASRAMYNFSQALSSGAVKLIDWKSIENANMATAEFKSILLETAKEMNLVEDAGDGMYKSLGTGQKFEEAFNATSKFNDSLSSCWMTSEVLIKALQQYSDADTDVGKRAYAAAQDVKTFSQMMDTLKEAAGSGWAESMELIIGDFEEAKELFTGINNIVSGWLSAQSDWRNGLLRSGLKEIGATENYLDAAGFQAVSDKYFTDSEYFIEECKKAAKEHGVAIDQILDDEEEFKKSLESGWLTEDIATIALSNIDGGGENYLSHFFGDAQLALGDTSDAITSMQKVFEDLGYDLGSYGTDGIFGPYTQSALKAFQASKNLEETGQLNADTLKALDEAYAEFDKAAKHADGSSFAEDVNENAIKGMNGRQLAIEGVYNSYQALAKVLAVVGVAFDAAFPDLKGTHIYNLAKGFNDLSKKLYPTNDVLVDISKTSKGVFRSLNFVREGVVKLGGPILSTLGKGFKTVARDTLSATGALGGWVSTQMINLRSSKFWDKAQAKLNSGLDVFSHVIGSAYEGLKKYIKSIDYSKALEKVSNGYKKVTTYLSPYTKKLGDLKNKMVAYLKSINSDKVQAKLSETFSKLGEKLQPLANKLNYLRARFVVFFKAVNPRTGKTGAQETFDKIKEKIENLWGTIKGAGEKIVNFFKKFKKGEVSLEDAGKGITGSDSPLTKFAKFLRVYLSPVITVGAISAIAGLVNAFVRLKKLKSAVGVLDSISGYFKALKKSKLTPVSMQVLQFAVAIGILVAAVYALAKLKPEEIAQGIKGLMWVLGLAVGAFGTLVLLNKFLGPIKKIGEGMLYFATGMLVLVGAMYAFYLVMKFCPEAVGYFLLLTIAMGVFFAAMQQFAPDTGKIGQGFLQLGASILLLAVAMRVLAKLSIGEIVKGLVALAGIFAVLGGTAFLMDQFGVSLKNFNKVSKGLIKTAAAVLIFAVAIAILGSLKLSTLAKGIGAMAASIGIMYLMSLVMQKIDVKGVGMIILLAGAMVLLGAAVNMLAGIDFVGTMKGLGAMVIVIVALTALSAALGALATSFPMVFAGIGIIAALGAAFILLDIAIHLIILDFDYFQTELPKVFGSLKEILGGFIGKLPDSFKAVGEMVKNAFSGVFSFFSGFGGKAKETLSSGFSNVKEFFGNAFSNAKDWVMNGGLSDVLDSVKQWGTDLLGKFEDGIGPIKDFVVGKFEAAKEWIFGGEDGESGLSNALSAATTWGTDLLGKFEEGLGPIKDAIIGKFETAKDWIFGGEEGGGLGSVLSGATTWGSDLITNLTGGLVTLPDDVGGYFTGLWENTIQPALEEIPGLLMEWAQGLPGAIVSGLESTGASIGTKIKSFFTFGADSGEDLTENGEAMGETVTDGIESVDYASAGSDVVSEFSDAIDLSTDYVFSSGQGMGTEVKDGISDSLSDGESFVGGLFSSIFSGNGGESDAKSKGARAATSAVSGVASKYGDMYRAGTSIIGGSASGVETGRSKMETSSNYAAQGGANALDAKYGTYYSKGVKLAEAVNAGYNATLEIKSPSRVMYRNGIWTAMGTLNALDDKMSDMRKAGESLGDNVVKGTKSGLSIISDVIDGSLNIDPTIRPVFDMSDLESGIASANSLLAATNGFSIGGTVSTAFNSRRQNGNQEVIDAISGLKDSISGVSNTTYNVNGLSYENGTTIATAVEALISAVVQQRRA